MLRGTEDHVPSVEHGNIQGGEMYVCGNEELRTVNSIQVLTHGMAESFAGVDVNNFLQA